MRALAAASLAALIGCGGEAPSAVPNAPNDFRASVASGEVRLNWDAVAGASSYTVYWSGSPGVRPDAASAIPAIKDNSYRHAGLSNGVPYYYVVTATNAAGESQPSEQVSAVPSSPQAPAAPSALFAAAGDQLVTLSWAPVPGATDYTIYWGTAAGVTPASGTPLVGASPLRHEGLENGRTYHYVLVASNRFGIGTASPEASAMPIRLEVEPNDRFAIDAPESFYDFGPAQPLGPRDRAEGTVGDEDVDWWRLSSTEQGLVTLTLTPQAVPGVVDLDLHVIDPVSRFHYGDSASRNVGSSESITLAVRAGVDFFVSVHDFAWSGQGADYVLTTALTPAALSSLDDNDAPSRAIPLGPTAGANSDVNGTIDRPGDADWHVVARDPDLSYRFQLVPPAGEAPLVDAWFVEYNPGQERPWGPASSVLDGTPSVVAERTDAPLYLLIDGRDTGHGVAQDPLDVDEYAGGVSWVLNIRVSPHSPAPVTTTLNGDDITLSWPVTNGATTYMTQASLDPDPGALQEAPTLCNGSGTTCSYDNAVLGEPVYFLVRSVAADGLVSNGTFLVVVP